MRVLLLAQQAPDVLEQRALHLGLVLDAGELALDVLDARAQAGHALVGHRALQALAHLDSDHLAARKAHAHALGVEPGRQAGEDELALAAGELGAAQDGGRAAVDGDLDQARVERRGFGRGLRDEHEREGREQHGKNLRVASLRNGWG
jgi:hypothetical protein